MKRAWRLIAENFGWKIVALVSAFGIWALVSSEPELSVFVRAPLAYQNLPDDLEISTEPVNTVSLELRGPSGDLRELSDATSRQRAAVVLDMAGVQPGERTFPIGSRSVKLPRSVRLVRAIPSEARFEFEKRGARRVPVTPRFSGDGAGYGMESFVVEPQEVAIAGPASHVARIPFVTTDRIDISGVVGSAEFRVNAFVDDAYVRFEGSPQVTVTVVMKKNQ